MTAIQKYEDNVYNRLKIFAAQFVDLSEIEIEQFFNAFTLRRVSAGRRLVDLEQISREAFFIGEGCVRLYYDKDGEEITGFIFTEGMIASSFASFLNGEPSLQMLETIEDCQLLVITHDSLERLYRTLPAINVLMRKYLEQRLLNAQKIISSFIIATPEERYLQIIEQNPQILQRLPQHKIASLLGITPVSLSRIRRRLMEK